MEGRKSDLLTISYVHEGLLMLEPLEVFFTFFYLKQQDHYESAAESRRGKTNSSHELLNVITAAV